MKKYDPIKIQLKSLTIHMITMDFFLNTEEEADKTSIHSINATNEISMIDDDNFIQKYYAQCFCQITMKMYLLDQNMIQRNKRLVFTILFVCVVRSMYGGY